MPVTEVLETVMLLLGGLGAFLAGMEIMSESMSRLAPRGIEAHAQQDGGQPLCGRRDRRRRHDDHPELVRYDRHGRRPSSTRGILTLFQATAIIMGANIGTTITAWIASLGSLDVSAFLLLFAVVGVFMKMLSKRENIKLIGDTLTGIGLVFVGLSVMSSAMDPDLHPEMMGVIKQALEVVKNPFLLLLIGAVATGIIQSSSAVTSIVVVLATSGVLIGGTGDGVYYVVIGSNIGTCVTALLSSIGAQPNARRAAIIHLLFNCFGAVIFTIFLLCWGWFGTSFQDVVLNVIFPENYQFQIAFFHTLFNVTCTIPLPSLCEGLRVAREQPSSQQEGGADARRRAHCAPRRAPSAQPFRRSCISLSGDGQGVRLLDGYAR